MSKDSLTKYSTLIKALDIVGDTAGIFNILEFHWLLELEEIDDPLNLDFNWIKFGDFILFFNPIILPALRIFFLFYYMTLFQVLLEKLDFSNTYGSRIIGLIFSI